MEQMKRRREKGRGGSRQENRDPVNHCSGAGHQEQAVGTEGGCSTSVAVVPARGGLLAAELRRGSLWGMIDVSGGEDRV